MWKEISNIDDIKEDAINSFRISKNLSIIVFKVNEELYVYEDRCTHKNVPLSIGSLTKSGNIRCAMHLTEYDPKTGINIDEEFIPLKKIKFKIDRELLFIKESV